MTLARPDARDGGIPDLADGLRWQPSRWDAEQRMPRSVSLELAGAGRLGAVIPEDFGGAGLGLAEFGELCFAAGRVCSSLRSLLTVQNMVADALLRWGSAAQRERWLPPMASGELIAGLAATEIAAGSDLGAVTASAERVAGGVRVRGEKRWITFGEWAGVYLVLALLDGKLTTLLVDREAPGVQVTPIRGQLGLRAAMLADVRFDCVVGQENILGRPGLGLSLVVNAMLDHGRLSVAWGCAGLVQECLERSVRHAALRRQSGSVLAEHQLVRRMLSDMMVDARTTRLLCEDAARLLEGGRPDASTMTMMAKYAAAAAAARVSSDAVQVHGAAGCAAGSVVERCYRDAKIMQIIEGSDQISQLTICAAGLRKYGRESAA